MYNLPAILEDRFDIVYTSRGVLCWLKDLDAWAGIIAKYLKPGGFFYILESHPVLNMFEETKPGELAITYRYFHRPEPICWDDDYPDYADESYTSSSPSYEWDWTVSDILNALIKAGLVIDFLNEYEQLFFKRYPGMAERGDRQYWFPHYAEKLPLIFTLKASKP
ncbi:MAG: class I SAM-dependent methyltransferase [Anaerolineales bacterium]|nr:class I SAM-dependent methyltransferase [Anaerolineales bacterium]